MPFPLQILSKTLPGMRHSYTNKKLHVMNSKGGEEKSLILKLCRSMRP
jgi:hypothetical protein